MENKD